MERWLLIATMSILFSCSHLSKLTGSQESADGLNGNPEVISESGSEEKLKESTVAPTPEVIEANRPVIQKGNSTSGPNAFYYFNLGEHALEKGQFDSAIENFKLAVIHDPDSAESFFHLAEAYMRKQMFPEAITAAKKSIALDPKYANAHLLLGGLYSSSEMFDDAIKEYELALQLDPTSLEARFVLSMIYAEKKSWTKSVKLLQEILDSEPRNTFALYYMGRVHELQDKMEDAKKYYSKSIELKPGLSPSARALSVIYENENDYQGLISLYTTLLNAEPENTLVQKKIAQTYLVMDNYPMAKQFFEEYLKSEKEDTNAQITFALILLETKDFTRAQRIFSSLLEQYPTSDKVNYYLGLTYEAKKEIKDAVESFLRVASDSEHFLSSMAHVVFHLKETDPTRALQVVSKAVEDRSDIAALFDLKAQIFEHQNDLKNSMLSLEDGLKKHPKDEAMLYYFGTLQHKVGAVDNAITTMKNILEINPSNSNALNFLGYTYAETGKDLGLALDMVTRALASKPNDPFILDSLGWIHYKKGDFEKAVAALEKAAALKPNEAVIYTHLGEAYLKLNLIQKASSAFKDALAMEKDPNEQLRLRKLIQTQEEQRLPAAE